MRTSRSMRILMLGVILFALSLSAVAQTRAELSLFKRRILRMPQFPNPGDPR